jgi:hypothetical protein
LHVCVEHIGGPDRDEDRHEACNQEAAHANLSLPALALAGGPPGSRRRKALASWLRASRVCAPPGCFSFRMVRSACSRLLTPCSRARCRGRRRCG